MEKGDGSELWCHPIENDGGIVDVEETFDFLFVETPFFHGLEVRFFTIK
jgi:hypothetical protein